MNVRTFDLKLTLCYYCQNRYKTRDRFLALSNSTLKVVGGKSYSKFGIILEVNNEVVVKPRMAKRCIADYTNISLHGFANLVIQILVV